MRAFVAFLAVFLCANAASADTRIWINEFNYGNLGAGESEFVEIVVNQNPGGPGFNNPQLDEIQVDLYDGATGTTYATTTLDQLPKTSDAQLDYFLWDISMQDGDPDGISLAVFSATSQFFSYGGTFTATNGPALGILSTDIGFTESDTNDVNQSIGLTGVGETFEGFSWSAPMTATPGSLNMGQTVPEPGSGLLLASAAVWCLSRRRKRRAG